MRLSADELIHHPWFADMKTRMKVRPYKPRKGPSLSPRLRRFEEDNDDDDDDMYSNERGYLPIRSPRQMMLMSSEERLNMQREMRREEMKKEMKKEMTSYIL